MREIKIFTKHAPESAHKEAASTYIERWFDALQALIDERPHSGDMSDFLLTEWTGNNGYTDMWASIGYSWLADFPDGEKGSATAIVFQFDNGKHAWIELEDIVRYSVKLADSDSEIDELANALRAIANKVASRAYEDDEECRPPVNARLDPIDTTRELGAENNPEELARFESRDKSRIAAFIPLMHKRKKQA